MAAAAKPSTSVNCRAIAKREHAYWTGSEAWLQGFRQNPWQTDTCIGDWHYNREAKYKITEVRH